MRALLLQELARYRARGVFPKNRDFDEQTPYFVDADGTRCAMAHLLEVGGEAALVARIAEERNHAWVRELADEPRLLAWLAAAGLTVNEAAAIQPSYCGTNAGCVCGDDSFSQVGYPVPATGVLEGLVVGEDANGYAQVQIDIVHGDGNGYQVGDTFTTYLSATNGGRVLAPIDGPATVVGDAGAPSPLAGVLLDADGNHTCQTQAVGPRIVGRELFLDAVQSSDCAATLIEADASWGRNSCDGDPGGCAVGAPGASGLGGGAPTTLGVLIAIVSALAARRALGAKRPSARAKKAT